MKPGDLVTPDLGRSDGTHRWTLLTRYPDQFDPDDNPEVYTVRHGEVGIVLAIVDVEHADGNEYREAFVLFGKNYGWNAASAFKHVE